MTVQGLARAKKLVNEIGMHKVLAVYRYSTIEGIAEHYAIFLVGQFVDVFNNVYVVNPVLVYTMAEEWDYDG